MKNVLKTAALCLATVIASIAAYSAIELTTPEVKPAVTINAARIVGINVQFYEDGVNLGAAKCFVAWEKGNVADGKFTVVTTDNTIIPVADFAAILLAAETATPVEYLLGDAEHKTPMDKIFPALAAYLKGKGKM